MSKLGPVMTKEEMEHNFLQELTAISRKYRLAVDGCGCCGSPFLVELPEDCLEEYTASHGIPYQKGKKTHIRGIG